METTCSFEREIYAGYGLRRRGLAHEFFSLGEQILVKDGVNPLKAKVHGSESIRWLIGQGYVPDREANLRDVLELLLERDANDGLTDDIVMLKSADLVELPK